MPRYEIDARRPTCRSRRESYYLVRIEEQDGVKIRRLVARLLVRDREEFRRFAEALGGNGDAPA